MKFIKRKPFVSVIPNCATCAKDIHAQLKTTNAIEIHLKSIFCLLAAA